VYEGPEDTSANKLANDPAHVDVAQKTGPDHSRDHLSSICSGKGLDNAP
jgi:hypothetical protein